MGDRPAPERFLELIREQQRGRLKVYLGFAAGVGKTYEMLQEGQRLKKQGVDVVIGIIETHGRADTAALGDLEQVPRQRIEYRGVVLEEMDIDALLKHHPQVALVDELAHTNAPDSRNGKRYQDVQELLQAGIHVISTLNIQHLESLYDIVERCTGGQSQRARSRLHPRLGRSTRQCRSFRGRSARPPAQRQGLSARTHRKCPDQLFRRKKLTRLREMALEEIRYLLDRRRQTHNAEAQTPSGRVMVCLSSRSPNPHVLSQGREAG